MGDKTDRDRKIKQAEEAIRRLLLDLQDEIGERVERVEVDTRNFANLATEIWFE